MIIIDVDSDDDNDDDDNNNNDDDDDDDSTFETVDQCEKIAQKTYHYYHHYPRPL